MNLYKGLYGSETIRKRFGTDSMVILRRLEGDSEAIRRRFAVDSKFEGSDVQQKMRDHMFCVTILPRYVPEVGREVPT